MKDGSRTPTKASVKGCTSLDTQKVPPAPGMDVDVPVSTTPEPISSTTILPSPVPAEYTLVVNNPPTHTQPLGLRGLASSMHKPDNQMVVDSATTTTPTQHDSCITTIVNKVSLAFESCFSW